MRSAERRRNGRGKAATTRPNAVDGCEIGDRWRFAATFPSLAKIPIFNGGADRRATLRFWEEGVEIAG